MKYHSQFGNEQRLTKSKAKNPGKEQQDCDPHTLLGGVTLYGFFGNQVSNMYVSNHNPGIIIRN